MMKKTDLLYKALFVLLMLVFFVPLVQQEFELFEVRKLDGASMDVAKPELTFDNYRSLGFQGQSEQYAASHFGFHESVIRLYNQYLLMYRKTYAADVVIGKEKWLYGKNSVLDHYGQLSYSYAENNEALELKFQKDLGRLKRVQSLLDERGTKLFVLICPSKDEVYPEHLPTHGRVARHQDGLRAIDYYPKAFEENGINYLNACEWFQQLKDTVSYPLFPMRGMHWSNIACAHAADSIIRYMEHLTGINALNVKIGPSYPDNTRNPDNDLEKNLNLAWGILPAEQNYYSDVNVIPDTTARRLRLITMGDSFFWNMCYSWPMDELFETYRYWYYFNTIFYDPNHTNVSQIDLLEELDHADVVMISLSATQLYEINHNFLSQALFHLSVSDPGVLDSLLEGIKQNMRNTPEWYEGLKKKAEQSGKTIDEVMDEDARYIFNQEPEKYLD